MKKISKNISAVIFLASDTCEGSLSLSSFISLSLSLSLTQTLCYYYYTHTQSLSINTAESTHRWGKDHCTTSRQFNKIGFDQKEHLLLFVCSEAVESKLVKLETSRSAILPPNGECFLNTGSGSRSKREDLS